MSDIDLIHKYRAAIANLDSQLKHVVVSPNFGKFDARRHSLPFKVTSFSQVNVRCWPEAVYLQ